MNSPAIQSFEQQMAGYHSLTAKGDYGEALQVIQRIVKWAREVGTPSELAEVLIWHGSLRCRLGHYLTANSLVQEAQSNIPPGDSNEALRLRCLALTVLSHSACETNDLERGEEYIRQALDLARQLNDLTHQGQLLHYLSGGLYSPRGQFALSLAADQEAIRMYMKAGKPADSWGAWVMTTYVYLITNQLEKAQKAADELGQIAVPSSLAHGYDLVWHGWLSVEKGELELAADFFAKARALAEKQGAPEVFFELYIGLSRLARATGDLAQALSWAGEAAIAANRIGYVHYEGRGVVERGRCNLQLGHLGEAEQDFRKAIDLMSPLRVNFDCTRALFFLAATLQQAHAPSAATTWVEAVRAIETHSFQFLLEQERSLAYAWVMEGLESVDLLEVSAARNTLEVLQKVPPSALRICLLGGLRVQVGVRFIDSAQLRQRRCGELLSLLLLSPNYLLTFDEVADELCPDQPFDSAKSVIHHATSTLRRLFEPDLPDKRFPSRYLDVQDGSVHLLVPPGSWIDVQEFQRCISTHSWQAAITLYGGDLLPEYRYATWAVASREAYAEQLRSALLAQAEIHLAGQEWQAALGVATRCISLEPWRERATEIAMQACVAMQDIPSALRYYRRLDGALQKDLRIEPSEPLQLLYRSLLKSRRAR